MINVNKVTFYYNKENKLIDNVSLKLDKKKIGIIGSNGCGKSTLLKLIKGLITPVEGDILIENKKNIKNKVRKEIGLIFQNPDNQIVFPTVEEDLSFGLMNFNLTKDEIKEKIDKFLNLFNLHHIKNKKTYELSGGEKQVLVIIGILIMEPKYLLFDEPTTFLDLKNKNRIFHIINSLQKSCVVATHDLDFLYDFDEVIYLKDGKVEAVSNPPEVIKKYKNNASTNFKCFFSVP